jgi:predicted small secreted protein
MKSLRTHIRRILLVALLAAMAPALSSCGTTTENGVEIDKGNPLKFW